MTSNEGLNKEDTFLTSLLNRFLTPLNQKLNHNKLGKQMLDGDNQNKVLTPDATIKYIEENTEVLLTPTRLKTTRFGNLT